MGYNAVLDSFVMVSNFTNNNYYNSDTTTHTTIQYNVIATYTGNVSLNNVYIVGGHYDDLAGNDPMNIAPGADDDASGIAGTIEIARVIKEIGYIPESTIKFVAFAAEEAMVYYSDVYGSLHFVNDAMANNENIDFFITNDMISNTSDSLNWKFNINYHTTSGFTVQLANEICNNYTTLTPVNNLSPMVNGADNIPFARVGIPALYFSEYELSPHYHSEGDTVGNCNMAYCAEITKVSAGMLVKASESPANIKNLFIVNPGDGHTLIPTWKRNFEGNLAYYKVYIGRSPSTYDSVVMTTDTFYNFNTLINDTLYYIGVTAINNRGTESYIIEKSDAPGLAPLNEGILIIKDSKLGMLISSEQQLDDFYNEMCDGFNHSQYDAASTNKISLNVIGKYSSLIWYVNRKGWSTSILPQYHDLLRNYLNLGGHILFTLYQPSRIMENNTINNADFYKGSFIYDYANISKINDTNSTKFCGTIPVYPDSDSLFIDSLKIPAPIYYHYQLPFIEAIYPSINGNAIYLFNSGFDSTTLEGRYINRPVGVENLGPEKNVVTLSFPLYYIKADQAKAFVHKVMADKFHENYTGINEENNAKNSGINIYPNPANDQVTLMFPNPKTDQLILYDMHGTIKYQAINILGNTLTIDLSKLSKGFYILKAINGKNVDVRKIIKA